MSVLYGKVRVNAKNLFPFDPTITSYPISAYGVRINRDSVTGIFTISGLSTDSKLYYLNCRSGAWQANNYVGMKLKCYGSKLNNFYIQIRYYNSSSDAWNDYAKRVNIQNQNEYTIENYPYIMFGLVFSNTTTFDNDWLGIILYDAQTQIIVTSALGITKTVNMSEGASYVDIPLVGLEEYTLTVDSRSETVLLNYGEFKEIDMNWDNNIMANNSWLSIRDHLIAGTLPAGFVGQTKPIILNGNTYNLQLARINDGTGAAGIYYPNRTADFISVELMPNKHNMNSTDTTVGGWKNSAMRTYLTNTIYPALPKDLKSVIIDKTHMYTKGNKSTSYESVNDKLWLPTIWECSGSAAANGGDSEIYSVHYSSIFSDNDGRRKLQIGQTSASAWWSSTAVVTTEGYFCCIYSPGYPNNSSSSSVNGVVLGLRIG